MESVFIRMNSAAYLDIAHVVLPATKFISIGVSSLSRGDPSGLPAINRILENARGSETLEMRIMDSELRVVPESITCTTLAHLLISAPTSVDTMLEFIKVLPNLVMMMLNDLDLSDIRTDMSVPDADDESISEPLHTSLRTLTLDYDRERHSPDTAVTVVKCVLLRIPTLEKLCASQVPVRPVASFIKAHMPRYPHLSSVELILDEDGEST
ncbi:hypothetical protein H4R21_000378 [Coemansia helicoidea]|uniref:Uncharacterized protein n=1 Tax=Coemansia helicoidea TaxID=1286919 RepID=A0ACC1LHI6_9FUNG|nr:hypothetical protein H4R21_000378 [Coemansia helicoidea]